MLGSNSENWNSSSEKKSPDLESNQGSSDVWFWNPDLVRDRFDFLVATGSLGIRKEARLTLTTGRLKKKEKTSLISGWIRAPKQEGRNVFLADAEIIKVRFGIIVVTMSLQLHWKLEIRAKVQMREELDRPTFRRIMSDPSRLLLVSNPRSIWYHWIDYRFRQACHWSKK